MRIACAALAWMIALAANAAAQTTFVSVMEDVPLAPGLTETGTALSFASAEGQILQAAAVGAVKRADIEVYYAQALPALGWSTDPEAGALVFKRGRELLAIDITASAPGVSEAKFRLVARQAPPKLD
jgi:hypothetical protein